MRWPLGIYRVAGDSMRPTYAPGDTLLGWYWFVPRVGDVVVVRHDRPIIKRISRIDPDDRVHLLGDNPIASTDSRHFGPVRRARLEAKILAKIG